MARNLPVAFAAVIAGGVLVDAAIKGASIGDVIKGQAKMSSSSGSTSGAGSSTSSGKGAVNPFAKAKGLVAERVDQGQDFRMNPGSPILAPFTGKVTAINPNWYAGQPQIVIEGTGAFAGKFFYLAEQILPDVHVGQSVTAGQQIATYAGSGTGIEVGWAANAAGETEARATTGYTEGEVTPAGSAMKAFLASLGVHV